MSRNNGKAPPFKVRWHRAVAESRLPGHLKHTAWAVETVMNLDGYGYGKLRTLAAYGSMGDRTLTRNAAELARLGWWEWRSGSGRGNATTVQATIPVDVKVATDGDISMNGHTQSSPPTVGRSPSKTERSPQLDVPRANTGIAREGDSLPSSVPSPVLTTGTNGNGDGPACGCRPSRPCAADSKIGWNEWNRWHEHAVKIAAEDGVR
jgi:hypothetical protein